jgi:tetratricopeptide (TPR) repeat protein
MMIRTARKARGALLPAALASMLVLAAPASAVQTAKDGGLNSLSGTYLAARTADAIKDVAGAAAFYREALETDPENMFLLERAVVLTAAAGDVGAARDLAEKMAKASPDNHAARLILAIESIRTEDYSRAIELVEESGSGVIADLTTALLVAWARMGMGEPETALQELGELEGEDWYEPFKLLHRGYLALASGRSAEAVEDLGKAHEADSNAVRIAEAYARALAVSGKTKEAEAVLEDFLSRFPENPLARTALDDIRAGNAAADAIGTPVKGAAEALAGIGAAVGQEGGLDVALLYLRLALYLDPQIAGGLAALSLGSLLDQSGQGEAAIAVYDSIAQDAPFRGLGQLRAALALDRMDRTEEAEKAFEEAIQRSPDDIQAYVSYGNMLRGRERYEEASALYSKAIAKVPEAAKNDWSLFYFRGITHERTDQWPKAEADFKKALDLYPDQPLVLNYLGYSWVDKGMNLDEALEMIRKAVELRPNDGYIVDSLGWAYYRLGRWDDAVTELERAVSLRPDDPVINDHLGDAYWKAGRTLEAQFQWRHARDFGAEGEELERILKKIAEGRLIEQERDAALNTTQPG